MARNIVVIGGGPAAVFAALEAKKKDTAAKAKAGSAPLSDAVRTAITPAVNAIS